MNLRKASHVPISIVNWPAANT